MAHQSPVTRFVVFSVGADPIRVVTPIEGDALTPDVTIFQELPHEFPHDPFHGSDVGPADASL